MKMKRLGVGRTAEVFLTEDGKALKLFYDGFAQGAIDVEKRNAELVSGLPISTPKFYGETSCEGRRGLLYDVVQGESLLPGFISGDPQAISGMAKLHKQIWENVCPEAEDIKARLAWQIDEADLPETVKAAAKEKLQSLPDGENLLHMDFHPDNVMETKDGLVVIDWNNMAKGVYLFDVARTAYLLQYSAMPPEAEGVFPAELRKNVADAYLQAMDITREEIADYMIVIFASRAGECTAERDMLLELLEGK